MDPETAEVKAAGCVVYRRVATDDDASGLELAVAHRPRYDDWSLPKGKLDANESWETAALREVHEEIGQRGLLGPELPAVDYRDGKGRRKAVRYWLLEGGGEGSEAFEPNEEVDALEWLAPDDALERLTYPTDRATVTAALQALR